MALHKCPFDNRKYHTKEALYQYMEKEYRDELHGLPAAQIYFNFRNRYDLNKEFGRSVVSGKPTPFNLTTERYERFANENERKMYREYFRKNMIKKYGKDTLLDDPEQQKIMLANRSISGEYTWSNGYKTQYTGSYEHNFLKYLDTVLNWDKPEDVMAPAPMVFPYVDTSGRTRFHFPDFYITSINLIINIKSSDNTHYRLRDIEDEKKQDAIINKSQYKYIKIFDNKYDDFIKLLEKLKQD